MSSLSGKVTISLSLSGLKAKFPTLFPTPWGRPHVKHRSTSHALLFLVVPPLVVLARHPFLDHPVAGDDRGESPVPVEDDLVETVKLKEAVPQVVSSVATTSVSTLRSS